MKIKLTVEGVEYDVDSVELPQSVWDLINAPPESGGGDGFVLVWDDDGPGGSVGEGEE